MPDDKDVLEQLNIQLGRAETAGDRKWLSGILAPRLAFRRGDGETYQDGEEFLIKVSRSENRETVVESIQLFGDRAIVLCVVTVAYEDGSVKKFHNLRLFIRHKGEWKLLGWANEPYVD